MRTVAEGQVGSGVAPDVEGVRVARRRPRPGWPRRTTRRPCRPAATGRPAISVSRVAVRRNTMTGVHQRSISSTAAGMPSGSARSRRCVSGCSSSAMQSTGDAVAQGLVAGDGEQPEEVLELLDADAAVAATVAATSSRCAMRIDMTSSPGSARLRSPSARGIRVEVGHALAGARVGHPAVCVGPGAQGERRAGQVRAARRVEGRADGVVGVLPADDAVGPVEEQPAVLRGHPEHVGEREQRQVGGDVAGGVDLVRPGEHPVDDRARVAADLVLERCDGPRRERPGEHPAQPGVLGRVHVEHHPAHVGEVAVGGGVTDLRATEVRGEGRGVAQHPGHVGVPEHEPVARAPRASRPARAPRRARCRAPDAGRRARHTARRRRRSRGRAATRSGP